MNIEQLDDTLDNIFGNSDWEDQDKGESEIEECETSTKSYTRGSISKNYERITKFK